MKQVWNCSCFVLFVWAISSEYLPMAVFVEDIDKLFDSYNSVKSAAPGKTLLSPLSDNSPHIGHWTKASMGTKSWIFLSGMPYKRCQFGCDRSILKGTFTWRTVPSQLYIGFHSRDYPETPNMAVSPHALERCKFGCGRSKMKGTSSKTKNLISFTCTSIQVFFLKSTPSSLWACLTNVVSLVVVDQ
jgi:hypothetical protein